jgi:hypothetical protein
MQRERKRVRLNDMFELRLSTPFCSILGDLFLDGFAMLPRLLSYSYAEVIFLP